VLDRRQYEQEMGGIVDKLLTLVYVMLLLAVVIALLGIVNTLALSVYERTRELGLLRAVGMTTAQVRAMVRWESVVISLIGALTGVALGVGVGLALAQSLEDDGIHSVAVPGVRIAVFVALAARRRCAGGDRSRSFGVPRRRPAGGGHRLILRSRRAAGPSGGPPRRCVRAVRRLPRGTPAPP
jgi:ABC-type antimicrobial peptide transport system permease subunit